MNPQKGLESINPVNAQLLPVGTLVLMRPAYIGPGRTDPLIAPIGGNVN
jgi:hypothetical protein